MIPSVTDPAVGPLAGRVALVTGVSRRVSIGYALARRLSVRGADVLVTSWAPHDAEQPWGADPAGPDGVVAALRAELPTGSGTIRHRAADLADAAAPAALIDWAYGECGALDVLVATHARSSEAYLHEITAAELDLCYAVNVRSTLLLARHFAARRDHARPGGRIITFTSGQHLGPMPNELPYIASKGALQQVTGSLAATLARHRVTVNCIDPGPTDTGYADPDSHRAVAARMPAGRWGQPDDVANLVEWLASDASGWITGQTLVADGGWSLRTGIPPTDA
ncbi:MAG: 3-oxoacyl-[acyl-carrier protein] reductase [Mycobacteriales bacterium]